MCWCNPNIRTPWCGKPGCESPHAIHCTCTTCVAKKHNVQGYVNGFMINPETEEVLLIRKNRPDFQAGKWNGIGGKIEPNESRNAAMVREFREETGVETNTSDWEHCLSLEGRDFAVHFYRCFVSHFPDYHTTTDELVKLAQLDWIHARAPYPDYKPFPQPYIFPTLDNMKWILPLIFSTGVRFPLTITWAGRS
jgi:8-oxo-dGTP pyrophosphatase MutT (NUDIX family)